MLHRQVVLAQHRAAVAHALDARSVVTGDIGLTFQTLVFQLDAAAAGNLLGALDFLLDLKQFIVLLAVNTLDNRLGEHVDAAVGSQDVQYLAACAREVDLLGHLIIA